MASTAHDTHDRAEPREGDHVVGTPRSTHDTRPAAPVLGLCGAAGSVSNRSTSSADSLVIAYLHAEMDMVIYMLGRGGGGVWTEEER